MLKYFGPTANILETSGYRIHFLIYFLKVSSVTHLILCNNCNNVFPPLQISYIVTTLWVLLGKEQPPYTTYFIAGVIN